MRRGWRCFEQSRHGPLPVTADSVSVFLQLPSLWKGGDERSKGASLGTRSFWGLLALANGAIGRYERSFGKAMMRPYGLVPPSLGGCQTPPFSCRLHGVDRPNQHQLGGAVRAATRRPADVAHLGGLHKDGRSWRSWKNMILSQESWKSMTNCFYQHGVVHFHVCWRESSWGTFK